MKHHTINSPFLFAFAMLLCTATVGLTGGCKKEETKADTQVAALPKEYTVDALKATSTGQGFDTFRQIMEREDLTEEQRRQAMDNAREVMEKRMEDRMNEYFTAPEDEKKKLLDKSIDEFEKMRKEREARDAEREKMSEEEKEKERQKWKDRMGNRDKNSTQAERKNRSESRSADKQGKRMAYFSAMQERMKERGITPPERGPFGGSGPGGRGRGPGG